MKKKYQYLIIGIMCLILTTCICIQIRTVNSTGTTVSTNQTENELRDQVLKMKEKYEDSYAKLQEAEAELETVRESVTNNNDELKSLEEEIKEASTLLGLTDVQGQGVTITVTESTAIANVLNAEDFIVHNTDLLSIVNELKNAGAEAISINDQRVVSTTYFAYINSSFIQINGERVTSPYTIKAIGDPDYLKSSLVGTGGYAEKIETWGQEIEIEEKKNITISKYDGEFETKYIEDED